MGLTQAQRSMIQRARSAGGGELGCRLGDASCTYLLATIVRDLNLFESFPEFADAAFLEFFEEIDPRKLELEIPNFLVLAERLFDLVEDSDTYFDCLASLQKSRLKYSRILEYQPLPTMDQVGPRALLQYGQMSSNSLAVLLFWRKWIYDIDNRSAQETGYLFQPIIANALGGATFSSTRSPIHRHNDPTKGRQVDCIRDSFAYEIKIRVTIAASGQGRWQEELDFPIDCRSSGYIPILVVLDPTPNPKLNELIDAFSREGGQTYVGDAAWNHFEEAAGQVMDQFLEKYIRVPLQNVLAAVPERLPEVTFRLTDEAFIVEIADEITSFKRTQIANWLEPEEPGHQDINFES